MELTQKLLGFALLGANWVLWLLSGLSLLSVATLVERALYYHSLRVNFDSLAVDLRGMLERGDFAAARARARTAGGVEAEVAMAGLEELERGPKSVAAAMMGKKSQVRLRLERNLAFLGTLGANAPFIGLFGTVLGIIRAFHDLTREQAGGITAVMAGISEALVATAVGLLVAIPAVVGFNFYNGRVRRFAARIDSLAHIILAAISG